MLKILKSHIAMGLNVDNINDNSIELQIRIAEIDEEFRLVRNILECVVVETKDNIKIVFQGRTEVAIVIE